MAVESRRTTVALRGAMLSLLLALTLGVGTLPAASALGTDGAGRSSASESAGDLASRGWVWPAAPFRLARPFVAPPHEYGPGHRGIDIDLLGGTAVRAPADGVVAFSGGVAGRG